MDLKNFVPQWNRPGAEEERQRAFLNAKTASKKYPSKAQDLNKCHGLESKVEVYLKRRMEDVRDELLWRAKRTKQKAESNPFYSRMSRRPLRELPLIVKSINISAIADSGAMDNIISYDFAFELGLHTNMDRQIEKVFVLGNGKIVKAMGAIKFEFAFANDPSACLERGTFYVLKTCVSALIIGMPLLQRTKTLTQYAYRLSFRPCEPEAPLRLATIDRPRQQLRCFVDHSHTPTFATADTGSEMNLVSLEYAKRRGSSVRRLHGAGRTKDWTEDFEKESKGLFSPAQFGPESESPGKALQVQFADGTIADIVGEITLVVTVGDPYGLPLALQFYVLPDLTCDLLFGQNFLEDHDIFDTWSDAFSPQDVEGKSSEINTIIWRNAWENILSGSRRLEGRGRNEEQSELGTAPASRSSREEGVHGRVKLWLAQRFDKESTPLPVPANPLPSFEGRLHERDAFENHQREIEKEKIAGMSGEQKRVAQDRENRRRDVYDRDRKLLVQARQATDRQNLS